MAYEQVGFDADALIAGGSALRREFLQNIGVKRLAGAELNVSGKVPNFLFYIEEIRTVAVYSPVAGLGDVWTGLFGQAVAGSQAVRDTIYPLEGQWFYNLDTASAEQYLGGVWETGASGPVLNAPSYVIVSAPRQLVAGRRYVITGDTTVMLPAPEDSLEGHVIELEAAPGATASVQAATLDANIETSEGPQQVVLLEPHGVYRLIYIDGQWVLHTSLIPTALYTFLQQVCEQAALDADQSAQEAESFRDQAEAAAQDAIAAAGGIVAGTASMAVFSAADGVLPTPPASSSGSWISDSVGTVNGLAMNIGDVLVYVHPAGTWHLIRMSNSFQIINGKSGATITLTAQDVLAVALADRVGPSDKVMTAGYRGAPTENDTDTFLTTGNFNPNLYLLRGATSVFGRLVVAATDETELRTLLGLTDAATTEIGTGADELVTNAILATALGSLGDIIGREVQGSGALITVGYGGLGGLAQEVAWITAGQTDSSRFIASSANSPIDGVRTAGITVRAGATNKHTFQIMGRSKRAFIRTFEGTTPETVQEIVVVPNSRTNMGVNEYGLDANAYRALGNYSVTQDVTNLPVAEDGTIIVGSVVTPEGGYALTQMFMPYSDINPRQYFRAARAGTFGAWAQALLSANLGTAASADIGEDVGDVMGVGAFGGPTGSELFYHTGNLDLTDFAPASHTHDAADINSGVLDAARIPTLTIAKIGGLQTALDSRALTTRNLVAGDGLTGGGDLSASRTFTLGTPSSVGNGSTNSVSGTTHTHALSLVAGDIPNLDASKITSGTLSDARLPSTMSPKTFTGQINFSGIAALRSDSEFQLLTASGQQAQQLRTGSVLASNAYADASKVPTNGIYSKGTILAESLMQSLRFTCGNTSLNSFSQNSYEVYSDDAQGANYGMRLWNTSGTTGDWGLMLYGPNQANRHISFGKVNTTNPTNFASITRVAFLDLDDGYFVAAGFVGNGSNLTTLNASALASGTVPAARLPITASASGPSGGSNGDIWLQYS